MANVPIVTDVTKVELDALVAANGLEEGLQYKITDMKCIVIALSSNSYSVLSGYLPNDNKIVDGSFPIVNANERLVNSVNLGVLNKKDKVILQFISSTPSVTLMEMLGKGIIPPVNKYPDNDSVYPINGGIDKRGIPVSTLSYNVLDFTTKGIVLTSDIGMCLSFLFLTENYEEARKYYNSYGTAEQYNNDVPMPQGFTYSDINTGVLSGFGLYFGNTYGLLGINKKLQLESAWLTQSGNDTVANFAIKNMDSVPTSAVNFKLVIYEN